MIYNNDSIFVISALITFISSGLEWFRMHFSPLLATDIDALIQIPERLSTW